MDESLWSSQMFVYFQMIFSSSSYRAVLYELIWDVRLGNDVLVDMMLSTQRCLDLQ